MVNQLQVSKKKFSWHAVHMCASVYVKPDRTSISPAGRPAIDPKEHGTHNVHPSIQQKDKTERDSVASAGKCGLVVYPLAPMVLGWCRVTVSCYMSWSADRHASRTYLLIKKYHPQIEIIMCRRPCTADGFGVINWLIDRSIAELLCVGELPLKFQKQDVSS
jgi:hypothetical protein